jgi:hypothetical protein
MIMICQMEEDVGPLKADTRSTGYAKPRVRVALLRLTTIQGHDQRHEEQGWSCIIREQ